MKNINKLFLVGIVLICSTSITLPVTDESSLCGVAYLDQKKNLLGKCVEKEGYTCLVRCKSSKKSLAS